MKAIMDRYRNHAGFRLFVQLLLIFVASRAFFALMVPIYNGIMGTGRSFSFLMNEWDAKKYQIIIDQGYTFPSDTDPQANWAFFPLYPLVCMAVKAVTFGVIPTDWVGMLVSNVCIFIAAYYGVKILRNMGVAAKDGGLLLGVFMLAGPYAFYACSVYTEAMFIMFIVLFFYCAMQRRYLLAGVMSALASGTRIVGCTLVFALILEMYLDFLNEKTGHETVGWKAMLSWKNLVAFVKHLFALPEKLVAIFLCPLGTFLYMLFLHFFCGDPWAFKNVQIAWREDTFFPIIGVLWENATGQVEPRYTYMAWICIAVLVLYGYMIYKKMYAMGVFGVIALLIPLTSHVMSTCRFIVGTFVVYVGLYDLLWKSKKKWVRIAALVVLALWEVILVYMWYNSDSWLL